MPARTTLRPLLIALALLLLSPLGFGQAGIANPLISLDTSPPVTRSDLRIIDSILGLDASQRELTGAIFDEYLNRYQTAAGETSVEIMNLIDTALISQDFDSARAAKAAADEWPDRRDEFRNGFYDDLKLLLDQPQIQLWPKVEREIRRADLIGNGRMVGESVDLIRLVDAHARDWADNPELVAMLDRYADRLDAALQARQRELDSDKAQEYRDTIDENPKRAEEIYRDVLPTRLRVRDTNVQAMREVVRMLPEEQAGAVEDAFYEEALSAELPRSPIGARIRAAVALPTLDAAQRDEINEAMRVYGDRQRRQLADLFGIATEIQEESLPSRLSMSLARARAEAETGEIFIRATGSLENPARIKEALQNRLELEREIWQRISAVLTPEQRAQMPLPDQEILWFDTILTHGL